MALHLTNEQAEKMIAMPKDRTVWASAVQAQAGSDLTKWIRSDILTDKIGRAGQAVKGQCHRILGGIVIVD